MMNNFNVFIDNYTKTIKDSYVKEAMMYALGNGKRFRPKLLFSIIKGFGLDESLAYHSALALEMIHTYSLIHDDLPCMDDDDFRRGKPSVHVAYGENIAVLAGDGLLTNAFKVVCDDESLSADKKVKIIAYLSELAGANGMIYGQLLDLQNENNPKIDIALLNEIDDYKTGCLFKCSLLIPMVICDDESNSHFYETLGLKIGRIFQIQDDLFDMTKSSEEIGKPSHSDEKNNKATALSLYSIDDINNLLDKEFDETFKLISEQKFDTSYIYKIVEDIKKR